MNDWYQRALENADLKVTVKRWLPEDVPTERLEVAGYDPAAALEKKVDEVLDLLHVVLAEIKKLPKKPEPVTITNVQSVDEARKQLRKSLGLPSDIPVEVEEPDVKAIESEERERYYGGVSPAARAALDWQEGRR